MRVRAAVFVVVLVFTVAVVSAPSDASPAGSEASLSAGAAAEVLSDSAWIESTTTADGALPEAPGSAMVSPYLANLAARGLAAAFRAGDEGGARVGWGWCEWYARHQLPTGFITDFVLEGDGAVSTGDMDSTDAYAGTFLSAVRDLYAATGDRSSLAAVSGAVTRALGAIEATQDVDGLTWAKPAWHVKYLMDQGEAFDGLVAASQLEDALGNDVLANRAARDASELKAGVASLWEPTTSSFDWAVNQGGGRQHTNWSVLYPDSMENVWAVAYGLTTAAQGAEIVSRLNTAHPEWRWPDDVVGGANGAPARVGFWPVGAWALIQDGQDPTDALTSIRWAATPRLWPYTIAVAGELIVASSVPLPSLPVPVPWAPRRSFAGTSAVRRQGAHRHAARRRAGDRSRTGMTTLEGSGSALELHPQTGQA